MEVPLVNKNNLERCIYSEELMGMFIPLFALSIFAFVGGICFLLRQAENSLALGSTMLLCLAVMFPLSIFELVKAKSKLIDLFDGALLISAKQESNDKSDMTTQDLARKFDLECGEDTTKNMPLQKLSTTTFGEMLSSLSTIDLFILHLLIGRSGRMIISSLIVEVKPEFIDQVWFYNAAQRHQKPQILVATLGDNFFDKCSKEQKIVLAEALTPNNSNILELVIGISIVLLVSGFHLSAPILAILGLVIAMPKLISSLYPKLRPLFMQGVN